MTPLKEMFRLAKVSGHPVIFHHRDKNRTIEAILPNGESLLCVSITTKPRNLSMVVTPDAFRNPATLMEVKNEIAHCWFVWQDNALHGQFHAEKDALQFIQA